MKIAIKENENIIIEYPVDINMVFARIPKAIQEQLRNFNVSFNPWYGNDNLTRFVSSWDTKDTEIKQLDDIVSNL